MKRMAAVGLCFAFLVSTVVFPATSFAQAVANKQAILTQARQSYYGLRNEGLSTFQCGITPNWEALLAEERKTDPAAADTALKSLNQLRFNVAFGADSTVKLTHTTLPGQQNQAMLDALSQIYGGMEQMTSGFFDTWKLFMVSSPFPAVDSEYQLESVGPQYRLSYKEDTSDVVTTMGNDYAISSLKVTTPDFVSVIQPSFTRTPKGFVLRAYDATYDSKKPEEATRLKVLIGNGEVEGFHLAQKLNLSGTYGASAFAIELTFSDCQVTKKE